MGLKEKLGHLKRAMLEHVDYIELADGSRYLFEPGEVWREVFGHGGDCLTADYRSEPRPDPPEILEAVARTRDRRSAAEKLCAPGTHPFMAYDIEALIEQGELVPRSLLAGKTYEESLEFFAKKNAKKNEGTD